MFFQVFLSVLSLNLLVCKKTNFMNINLSKKEANFILKSLNSAIESKKKDEHGEEYSAFILNGM